LPDRQCTLGEVADTRQVPGLSENQRKIISLLNCGMCQADIARKIKVSRSYVNQQIKQLLSSHLIKRIETHPDRPGIRSYTHFYELSPELKQRIKGDKIAEPFTSCRVHNQRMKITWSSSTPVSIDKRTSYSKSWTMRGGARHKYWFVGKAGMPSVTLDVHPKTIVAYCNKKQFIVAATPAEAMDVGWRAIYQAIDTFVELQGRFGVQIEMAHTGEQIGKPHGGFVGSESPVMAEGVTRPHWWIDRSQEAELGPGHPELETDIPEGMTRLDNLIKISENPAEMFKSVIDPLNTNVLQIQAMMQGSITNQQMLENVTKLISSVLIEMQSIRAENAELKRRLG
jgi:hypothetical protein